MNEYHESIGKQEHVIPILVTLTEEEWLEAQSFWSSEFLYFLCERDMMEDESKLEYNSNFGDFIRWLFKLAPSNKDICYVKESSDDTPSRKHPKGLRRDIFRRE